MTTALSKGIIFRRSLKPSSGFIRDIRIKTSIRRTIPCLSSCFNRYHCRDFASLPTTNDQYSLMDELRLKFENDIIALPEYRAQENLITFLNSKSHSSIMSGSSQHKVLPPVLPSNGYKHLMTVDQVRSTLDAAMSTFALHVEARIASLIGQGFYTIGPCGEEMLSSIGHALHPTQDACALHYRHLGVNLTRQLVRGEQTLDEILLDRARGFTVSKHDPVTGGAHCAIGSRDRSDYVVTSTLASQCPPAVGRALGFSLASTAGSYGDSRIRNPNNNHRPISFVTIGDGSVQNHHFLSSINLARHARHKKVKCPIVFGISDNNLSISYSTDGYANTLYRDDPLIPVYYANGNDMMDVYDQTVRATNYARTQSSPALIVYQGIVRRFGHAATDRQNAYLEEDVIQSMADTDVLASGIVQAVNMHPNELTFSGIKDRFLEIQSLTQSAFASAMEEEKVTREDMINQVSQPMVPVPRLPKEILYNNKQHLQQQQGEGSATKNNAKKRVRRDVMRKNMTKVIDESLGNNPDVIYIGEDVEHGGYYLVTEGLASKYPGRVLDFPPDETTLLGAGMGFAQCGLVPIVEIPYSKYLDCGVDMFYELSISNWLTNGQHSNGMIIRLQGFDRGKFGGNFHTHNMLSHIPPGVDVLCYSNGEDYVRGFRNAIEQAKAGRVVVFVDCTNLLNLRHLHDKDRGWERPYPPLLSSTATTNDDDQQTSMMSFHDVRVHGTENGNAKWAIVTYGNGVVTSLQARKALVEKGIISNEADLDIIDCPYISDVPDGLKEIMSNYNDKTRDDSESSGGVLFADICKDGPGSNVLSSMITSLHQNKLLSKDWELVCAPRTYNPLGNMVTFLNVPDIENGFIKLINHQQ